MEIINVYIDDTAYKIRVTKTPEEKAKGLQNTNSLPMDEGMLFVSEDDDDGMSMWMKNTHIPLDLVFIDDDWEVIRVVEGEPLSETLIYEEGARYVIELNVNSGVSVGDYVDLSEFHDLEYNDNEDDEKEVLVMVVLDSSGESQMDLRGGERIFSRPNTKTLIKMAKRAKSKDTDSAYKSLGKKIFSYIKQQDDREPDYVEVPSNN